MKKHAALVKITGLCVVGFALLLQFTNCASPKSETGEDSQSSLDCGTSSNCIFPNPQNLKIVPHIKNGQFAVTASLADFNIAGDCNEGGYANNTIIWELYLQSGQVRNSSMPVAAGKSANSQCVNGRFSVYVNLGKITGAGADTVDRTGLKTGSGTTRASYDLYIRIQGSSTSGTATSDAARVPLMAI
jgi:hypothetical protein